MFKLIALVVSFCCGWPVVAAAASQSGEKTLAADILVYINQFRVRHGLPKLSMSSVLTKEALHHSVDMASHRVGFGHDGFSQRIDHLRQKIQSARSGAENVAYNYKTAKIVAEGWINSPGHRRNILGHYNVTGIGIARDNLGRPYYTQLFLKTG